MCKMFQKMTMIYTNLEFHMNKNTDYTKTGGQDSFLDL